MSEPKTFHVLTDATGGVDAKQGFPGFDRVSRLPELREVDIGVVRANLERLVQAVALAAPQATSSSGFELDEVSLQAAIDAAGNVALLSVVGASTAGHTGIELRLRRRRGIVPSPTA